MGKPLKLAYLAGIGEYQWKFLTQWTKLNGPKNDTAEMGVLLENDFGFELLGGRPILDQEATYDNLKAGFEELTKALKGHDDSIVVYYHSGHGHHQKEAAPGSEEDREDEALVTHDCKYLWDNELNQIIKKLNQIAENLQVICIIDACHSGTILRGLEKVLVRMAPPRKEPLSPPQPEPNTGKAVKGPSGWLSKPDGKNQYLLMSACRDDQTAKEMPLGDQNIAQGIFTHHLADELKHIRHGNQEINYQGLLKKITDRVELEAAYQSPQIEGNLDWPILGGNWPKAPSYFEVTGIKGKTVSLKGGTIQGLHKGTILDIRGSLENEERTAGLRSIGKAEILDIRSGLFSTAMLEETPAFDTRTFRQGRGIVVGYSKEAESFKMNVLVDKDMPGEFQEAIGKSHLLKPIDKTGKAVKAWLHPANGKIWICHPDGNLYVREGFNNERSSVPSILERLERIARFNNLWSLRNDAPETCLTEKDIRLSVQKIDANQEGEEKSLEEGQYAIVRIGERIRINIVNQTRKPLYANVLLLNSDTSIELLYPESAGMEDNRVAPKKIKHVGDFDIVEPEGKFKFKLITSTKRMDLRSITQPGLADIVLRGNVSKANEMIKSTWWGSNTKHRILEEMWGTFDFPFWALGGQRTPAEYQRSLTIPCPAKETTEKS